MNTRRLVVLRRSRALLGLVAGLLAAALPGCTHGRRDVSIFSGKVTLNGAPLGSVKMVLNYPGGSTYSVPVRADGTFSVGDVPLGTDIKVTFEVGDPLGSMAAIKSRMPAEAQTMVADKIKEASGGKAKMFSASAGKVAERYTDPDKTPERVTITEGSTSKDFDLKE
jgi:hypothetical protein